MTRRQKKKKVDCIDIEYSSPQTLQSYKMSCYSGSRYYRSDATICTERDLKVINTARTNNPDRLFEIESSRLRIYSIHVQQGMRNFSLNGDFRFIRFLVRHARAVISSSDNTSGRCQVNEYRR